MPTSAGAFRANTPAIDGAVMEADLARIPSVTSARVVFEDDAVSEVHIVCTTARSPKLVGRDVQSLAAARWGIDLDHRKVSVVQLESGEAAPVEEARPVVEGGAGADPAAGAGRHLDGSARVLALSLSLSGDQGEVSVSVSADNQQATGRATGMPSSAGQRRLAAMAALDAVAQLDPGLSGFSIGDVAAVRLGDDDVIVATLSGWRNGAEWSIAGVASVGPTGELQAAAESVVQAALRAR